MNIVKKLFPKYKTQRELLRELWYATMSPRGAVVRTGQGNEVTVRASLVLSPIYHAPMDYAKQQLCRKLAEALEPYVRFDVADGVCYSEKLYTATITLVDPTGGRGR